MTNGSYYATIINCLYLLDIYSVPSSLPVSVRNLKYLEVPLPALNALSLVMEKKKKSM